MCLFLYDNLTANTALTGSQSGLQSAGPLGNIFREILPLSAFTPGLVP
jgi:hypothetical protein